jgi:hypothetical protein
MEVIVYNNNIYYIKRYHNETNSMFWERAWFIVKNSTPNEDNSEIIIFSKLWQSNKFYNCIYEENIMKKIKEYTNCI